VGLTPSPTCQTWARWFPQGDAATSATSIPQLQRPTFDPPFSSLKEHRRNCTAAVEKICAVGAAVLSGRRLQAALIAASDEIVGCKARGRARRGNRRRLVLC